MSRTVLLFTLACQCFLLCGQSLRELQQQELDFNLPARSQTKAFIENGNPKIDPALRRLASEQAAKSLSSEAFEQVAKGFGVPARDNLVSVTLTASSSAELDVLARRVQEAGGEVRTRFEDVLFADVPVDALEALGADRRVDYIQPQRVIRQSQDLNTPAKVAMTKGAAMIQAGKLHAAGITGRNIKIGVLDFGFSKYSILQQQGLLPAPVEAKAFGGDGRWDHGNTGTVHGTACAEIIHAVAPNALLYIASVGDGKGSANNADILMAMDWLLLQKVDVISFSGGGHGGPHDGRDPLDRKVDELSAKGILWVISAGNEGAEHWSGDAQRIDSQRRILSQPGYSFWEFTARGNAIHVLVNWNDWGDDAERPSATQDIDAYLFRVVQGAEGLKLVPACGGDPHCFSENPQAGRGRPIEQVAALSRPGEKFALVLLAKNVTRPVRVHVYANSNDRMSPATREGSIGSPATSKTALAVGAIDLETGKLEGFSSAGPTDDGRSKPEVSGPDNDESAAMGRRFTGTSASCPHVAGFAALLKQMTPDATPENLIARISKAVRRHDDPAAGNGMITADGLGGDTTTSSSSEASHLPPPVARRLEARIKGSGDPGELNPKIVVGSRERVYRIGDGLKLGYKVQQNCYFLLFHRESSGKYTLLGPSEEEEAMLEGGRAYSQPTGNKTIRVTGPTGTDRLVLLVSGRPLRAGGLEDADWDQISVATVEYEVTQ